MIPVAIVMPEEQAKQRAKEQEAIRQIRLEQSIQEYYYFPETEVEEQEPTFEEWLIDYCYSQDVSPYLVMAMIEHESECVPDKIGDSGESYGLMQIQPRWWDWLAEDVGVDNYLDERQNVMLGVEIIKYLSEINDDPAWVLMAYNGGEAYANKYYSKGIISVYADEILSRTIELEEEYENMSNM